MVAIKNDPSQTKSAAILIGALVVVIGVTVVRMKPAPGAQAPAQAQQVSARAAPVKASVERFCPRERNPFEKPAGLPAAGAVDDSVGNEGKLPASISVGGDRGSDSQSGAKATIKPLDPTAVFRIKPEKKPATAKPSTKDNYDAQRAKPEFTLLATARSGDSYSAVIRTGQSGARVVEVGDVLDGGFKVLMIDGDRAALSDGRQMIVAKRPRS